VAQAFLGGMGAVAFFTSRWWLERQLDEAGEGRVRWGWSRALVLAGTGLIFLQLILGATMRHQHAGLAIPDFPLAYGKVWPPTDGAFLERVNRERMDYREYNNVTAFHVYLHMGHRLMALLIVGVIGVAAWQLRNVRGLRPGLGRVGVGWFVAIVLQVGLGAWTVLSGKAADVATLHVVLGAFSLVTGILLSLALYPGPERWRWLAAEAGGEEGRLMAGGKRAGTVV
jgi:heme a synthase